MNVQELERINKMYNLAHHPMRIDAEDVERFLNQEGLELKTLEVFTNKGTVTLFSDFVDMEDVVDILNKYVERIKENDRKAKMAFESIKVEFPSE